MSNYSGDYFTAREKVSEGTDWRGTATVSFGDSTHELGHRLLNESEITDVRKEISFNELSNQIEDDDEGFEDRERLLELQQKGDLTDEEEAELHELSREAAQQSEATEDALGDEAYDTIMWAGKQVIAPTEDDLDDFVFNVPTHVQKEILGVDEIPDALSPSDPAVEEALKQDMVETVSNQPFPIKLNVGMQALLETMQVLGNGLDREDMRE